MFRLPAGPIGDWVAYVLGAAVRAMPAVPRLQLITSLLLTAWNLTSPQPTNTNAFLQALIRETKHLPLHLRPWPPVPIPLAIIASLMSLIEDASEKERYLLFMKMIRRLAPFDLAEVWLTFVPPQAR